MADDSAPTDVSVLKRISLRLDNGTRIGSSSALGMGEGASGVVKLDFVEGFTRGLVSEADLIRISEIAGQLEARRTSAAAGPGAPKPAGSKAPVKKESKRQRVVKQQVEVPDSWVQKGTRVLDSINKQKFSQWFREPVRPTATFVPDYFSIVKAPMDLGTAREKLRTGQYETSLAFAKDLDLIWDNAILYNGANTDVGKSASDLKRYSRSALKRAGLDTLDGPADSGRSKRQASEPLARSDAGSLAANKRPRASKQPRHLSPEAAAPAQPAGRGPYDAAQRDVLMARLEAISADDAHEALMEEVSDAVAPHVAADGQEIELDVMALPDEICWVVHDMVSHVQVDAGAVDALNPGPQVTGGVDLEDEETDTD